MDAAKTGRIAEIDVAKGFTLFLVTAGHVLVKESIWRRWIFMFHMPAFFFLSGMTFHPEKYGGLRPFIKEKWKKRILPYFIITFLGFFVCMLRRDYRQPIVDSGWSYMLSWIFYYGQPKNLYIGQIWFLASLFMAELIAYLWLFLFGKRQASIRCFSLAALAWASVNVSGINALLPWERLPWKLDTALAAAVFLIAGYYAAKRNFLKKIQPLAWFLIPFCGYLCYYYGPKWYGLVNMCDCIYAPAPYYFLAAFLGIGALLAAALLCKDSRFWQYCGRNTLPMFAFQTFAIYWTLDAVEWLTKVRYVPSYQMPTMPQGILISVSAFGLMILFSQLYRNISQVLCRKPR